MDFAEIKYGTTKKKYFKVKKFKKKYCDEMDDKGVKSYELGWDLDKAVCMIFNYPEHKELNFFLENSPVFFNQLVNIVQFIENVLC